MGHSSAPVTEPLEAYPLGSFTLPVRVGQSPPTGGLCAGGVNITRNSCNNVTWHCVTHCQLDNVESSDEWLGSRACAAVHDYNVMGHLARTRKALITFTGHSTITRASCCAWLAVLS